LRQSNWDITIKEQSWKTKIYLILIIGGVIFCSIWFVGEVREKGMAQIFENIWEGTDAESVNTK
jgi:hypothetical protein